MNVIKPFRAAITALFSLLFIVCLFSACLRPLKSDVPSAPLEAQSSVTVFPAETTTNPIDSAFSQIYSQLDEQDAVGEIFAYLYAKQWYNELVHVLKEPDDPYFSLPSCAAGDYLSMQTGKTLQFLRQDNTAAKQLMALANFYRSETLRFHALRQENAQGLDFSVDESTLLQTLSGTVYSPQTTAQYDARYPLVLAAQIPEKNIYLYVSSPFGMLLRIGHKSSLLLELPEISSRMILPEMITADIDKDGQDEIIISQVHKTGMGLTYIESQHLSIIEFDPDTGAVEHLLTFPPSQLAGRLEKDLLVRYLPETGMQQLYFNDQMISYPVPNSNTLSDGASFTFEVENLISYDLQTFPIRLKAGIVTYDENTRSSAYVDVAMLTADVVYLDKKGGPAITLEHITLSPPETR